MFPCSSFKWTFPSASLSLGETNKNHEYIKCFSIMCHWSWIFIDVIIIRHQILMSMWLVFLNVFLKVALFSCVSNSCDLSVVWKYFKWHTCSMLLSDCLFCKIHITWWLCACCCFLPPHPCCNIVPWSHNWTYTRSSSCRKTYRCI